MKGQNTLRIKFPKIRAEFSFFAFAALIFLLKDKYTASGFVMVCILHELGHLAAIFILGVKIKMVKLSGFGIKIETEKSGIVPIYRSILILLSGPAANTILYILLGFSGVYHQFAVLSLAAAVYNLLPYPQLDGGSAIELLITGSVYERELRIILKIVRICIPCAVLFIMLYERQF